MKNNTTQNNNITNIDDLQNVLGVKMEKKATTNKTQQFLILLFDRILRDQNIKNQKLLFFNRPG